MAPLDQSVAAGSAAGQGTGADTADPETVVRTFVVAVTAGRLEDAAALLHDDVVWVNGVLSTPTGPTAVLDEVRPVLQASDEADWTVTAAAASGNVVFLERLDRFRTGDTWVEVPVVGVFEVVQGRIARWRDYFDAADGAERLAPLFS